jgi:integrase
MRQKRQFRAIKVTDQAFAVVVRAFMASPKFQGYSQSIKDNWGRELRLIAENPDALGSVSVLIMRPALVQAYLDGMSTLPGKQEVAFKAIKQVERWAIVRDLLPNEITTGVEIVGSAGGHKPWRDEHVELAERYARRGFARIVTLAANTGQRGSDVVKMRWTDIETVGGRLGINVVQQKTGLALWIPFTQPLIATIESWERSPGFIVRRLTSGLPWTRKRLSSEWPIVRDSTPELKPLSELGLVLHGLRATACVRLSRAGATTRQIADWVGMSERMVGRYCRFSEQRENALAAVIHLDVFKGTSGEHSALHNEKFQK